MSFIIAMVSALVKLCISKITPQNNTVNIKVAHTLFKTTIICFGLKAIKHIAVMQIILISKDKMLFKLFIKTVNEKIDPIKAERIILVSLLFKCKNFFVRERIQ